jgi:hypothetical protein
MGLSVARCAISISDSNEFSRDSDGSWRHAISLAIRALILSFAVAAAFLPAALYIIPAWIMICA